MKVLIHHLGTRGAGPQLQVAIGEALTNLNVSTFYSYDAASEMRTELDRASNNSLILGARTAHLNFRSVLRVMAQPLQALKLLRYCQSNKIDLVFEPMGNPLQAFPRWLCRRFGIVFLTSVHDARRHAGEENILLSWLDKKDTQDTDGVMTYSQSVFEQVHSSAPVYMTVHGAWGKPAEGPRAVQAEQPVIGFFGRIEKYKGIDRFISTIAELGSRGSKVQGTIVGRGHLDEPALVDAELLNVNIQNRWIDQNEIQGIIEGFDVLALPYDEASQSGVVGFALNAGVPIVCTPVGGLEQQVREAGGLISSDMTPGSLADEIERLINSKSMYRAVSARQLHAAKDHFGWSRVAEDILHAAGEVLAQRSR